MVRPGNDPDRKTYWCGDHGHQPLPKSNIASVDRRLRRCLPLSSTARLQRLVDVLLPGAPCTISKEDGWWAARFHDEDKPRWLGRNVKDAAEMLRRIAHSRRKLYA